MRQLAYLLRPLLTATLIEPHATDVLQETDRTLDTSLIREVTLIAQIINDSLLRLDTHQAPGTAGQISKVFVMGRYGSHSGSCIMASDGNHGNGPQACDTLHFLRQYANHRARIHHLSKHRTRQSNGVQQALVELLGSGIEQLRSRCDGVFAHLDTSEHPAESIRHEENSPGILQGRIAFTLHGI